MGQKIPICPGRMTDRGDQFCLFQEGKFAADSPLRAVGHLGQRSNRRPGIAAILIVFVRDPDQHQLGGRVVQALLERP